MKIIILGLCKLNILIWIIHAILNSNVTQTDWSNTEIEVQNAKGRYTKPKLENRWDLYCNLLKTLLPPYDAGFPDDN